MGASFSLVAARGLLSGPEALAPCCAGLSGCRAQGQGVWAREVAAGLQSAGSVVVALGLPRASEGAQPCGYLDPRLRAFRNRKGNMLVV